MSDAHQMRRTLATVQGRCTGALFFSCFGGAWLLLALVYSHHFRWPFVLAIAAAVTSFAAVALRTQKRVGKGGDDAYPEAEKKANDRPFFLVNGVTYGVVFLLFVILPQVHASNYVFPAVVFIVGLHFLPMPPLYRHRANSIAGVLMMVWAVACVLLFHQDGEREAAYVTLGAGVLLWAGAVVALRTASRLLALARADGFYT